MICENSTSLEHALVMDWMPVAQKVKVIPPSTLKRYSLLFFIVLDLFFYFSIELLKYSQDQSPQQRILHKETCTEKCFHLKLVYVFPSHDQILNQTILRF